MPFIHPISIVAFIVGLLFLLKPDLYLKLIRYRNEMMGVKTKITEKTISGSKFVGWMFIGFAILSLALFNRFF